MNRKADTDRPTSLYRFFNASGELLYVGITSRDVTRWESHAKTKEWWPAVAATTVEHYDSRSLAEAAEAEAIRTERPRHNVVHSGTPASRRPPRRRRPRSSSLPTTPGTVVDLNDLVDAHEVAELLGLASANSVRVYRSQYPDFPRPVFPRGPVRGKPMYWYRPDVVRWRPPINGFQRRPDPDQLSF